MGDCLPASIIQAGERRRNAMNVNVGDILVMKKNHPCGGNRLAPLVGVLLFRIENTFTLFAVAPFTVCKGVHSVVNKGIVFHILND